MLDSPMTFGIEFEPQQIQYDGEGYDSKKIFEEGKLNVTLEFFPKPIPKKCLYNIEFVLGVYEIPRLRQFLNETYDMDRIREDISGIERFFSIHKENLRLLIENSPDTVKALGGDFYSDCSLSETSKPQDKYAYTKYRDNIVSIGVPQVTLGVNYAFFLPMLEAINNPDIPIFLDMFSYVITGLTFPSEIEESLVIRNFIAVLCYYCYNSSDFFMPEITMPSAPYLKARFSIKPRTNPAKSYRLLKEKYPAIENVLLELYQRLSDRYQTGAVNRLEFKLQVIETLINKTISREHNYEQVMYTLWRNYKQYHTVLYEMMNVDLLYLLRKIIFIPKRVIKVLKINPEKSHTSVEEGSIYRYTDIDKVLLDSDRYLLRYEIIEDAYASLELLPFLKVEEDGLLHASKRLEILEWIPEDSNLIIEVRAANKFAETENVLLENLPDFLESFLYKTRIVMRRYLINNGIIEKEKIPERHISSLLL